PANIASGLRGGEASLTTQPNCPKELLLDEHAIEAWHSNLGIMFERKSFAAEAIPHLINYCNARSKIIKIDNALRYIKGFTDQPATCGVILHPHVNANNIFTYQSIKL
ncbi:hypothetical protein, partial [Pseudoalteromonas sp. S1688]|uniref:hypothetical protein n=1 Tax=Pseudoalteromonas sp. S1688 TaxID=579511 RepID=UPI00127A2779